MATPQGIKMLMLVHDSLATARALGAMAARGRWRAVFAPGYDSAMALLDSREGAMLDAVVIDAAAGTSGERATFLSAMRKRRPDLRALLVLDDSDRQAGIAALRHGCADYIAGPVDNESLMAALGAIDRASATAPQLTPISDKLTVPLQLEELVGDNPAFAACIDLARQSAQSALPILITGEKGTGKEAVARAIHHASPHANGPFVTLNCAMLSGAMVGSALFGHERSAFPGAFDRQPGKLHLASKGTLFIDEIDALPSDAQQRLLYTLATGNILTIGGSDPTPLKARIIAAADRPLRGGHAMHPFREDLHYRLAATTLVLPPLKARRDDIPGLARHLLDRVADAIDSLPPKIDAGALALLADYDWPGNVRQLQAVLFRAALLSNNDELGAGDFTALAAAIEEGRSLSTLQPGHQTGQQGLSLYLADGNMRPLEDIEADIIRLAVEHYHGRMTEVARRLRIGRSTLYRKIADLGIDTVA